MELRQAARIWRARWILSSVLIILTMVGAAEAAAKMPRYYQSASSVVLLASHAAAKQNGGNPFLSFGPSLTLTADAVSRELMAPETARRLAAQGFTASYTVALPSYTTSTTGSVLVVTVAGRNAAGVQRTLQAVTAQVGAQLTHLQKGVPARGQIRAVTLSFTPHATLSISQTARPRVAVGALLLVTCFGIPIVVDGLVTRRRLRMGRRSWTTRRSRRTGRSLISWRSLAGPRSRRSRTIPDELAFPEGATGSSDQLARDDLARDEPRMPSSSWPAARNDGPSRRASGADR
jgi:hypothetical protein